MSDNPCPRCDRPIADSAYVCDRCRTLLARDLLRTASRWDAMEDAIGRRLLVDHPPTVPKAVERRVLSGPWCYGGGHDCGHPSCRAVWWSIVHRNDEPPMSREEPGLISLDASEAASVAGNVFTTWARHISEERGIDIPARKPARLREALPDPHDTDRPDRCHWSDLPIGQCACGRPHTQEAS